MASASFPRLPAEVGWRFLDFLCGQASNDGRSADAEKQGHETEEESDRNSPREGEQLIHCSKLPDEGPSDNTASGFG
jgi:hypothetical protein